MYKFQLTPIKLSHGAAQRKREKQFCFLRSAEERCIARHGNAGRQKLRTEHLTISLKLLSIESRQWGNWPHGKEGAWSHGGRKWYTCRLTLLHCFLPRGPGNVRSRLRPSYNASDHSQVRKGSLLFSADSTSLKRGIRSSDSKVPRSTFVPGRQSRKSGKRVCCGLMFMGVCPAFSPKIEQTTTILIPSALEELTQRSPSFPQCFPLNGRFYCCRSEIVQLCEKVQLPTFPKRSWWCSLIRDAETPGESRFVLGRQRPEWIISPRDRKKHGKALWIRPVTSAPSPGSCMKSYFVKEGRVPPCNKCLITELYS